MASNDSMNYGSSELGSIGARSKQRLGGRAGTGGTKYKVRCDLAAFKRNSIRGGTAGGLATAFELKSGLVVNPYTATTSKESTSDHSNSHLS